MQDNRSLPSQLHEALTRGAVVLTGNERAARTIRRAYDRAMQARGIPAWQPPAVFAWDSWLRALWRRFLLDGHSSKLLLSSTQEHAIWRSVIEADHATSTLRSFDSLALTVAAAFRLLHVYGARSQLQRYPANSDTRTFERWLKQFELQCRNAQYLPEAMLPGVLAEGVSNGQVPLPRELLLVGFDALTNAQESLLQSIRNHGATVATASSALVPADSALVTAQDHEEELTACANWTLESLKKQPNAHVAVIVPAMESSRADIDRVFRRILAPHAHDVSAGPDTEPYEFSLGYPLATSPLIACALDVLAWATEPLAVNRVSTLLLSRYLGPSTAAEMLARSELDAFVIRRNAPLQPQLSPSALYALARQSRTADQVPVLLQALCSLTSEFRNYDLTAKRSQSEWAGIFQQFLGAAQWGPLSHLDSTEFQVRKKWEAALDELTSLDFDNTRVDFRTALDSLRYIVANTIFAPETREAPVQIMGPLESAGSEFDLIWFLHAGELEWHASGSPNPLVPWGLQRDFQMPGADPRHDSDLVRRITTRIAARAPTVRFSFAQTIAEGHQRPSPALRDVTLQRISASSMLPESEPDPVVLEKLADTSAIPPPSEITRGGASVLQLQAACAFRAFAEKRLFSTSLDSSALGLDAGDRGSVLHRVLEKFWAEVRTQSGLKELTADRRNQLLESAISAALLEFRNETDSAWAVSYLEMEKSRLLTVLNSWLTIEAERSVPFRVKSLEESRRHAEIGPLRLELRIDRIDELLPRPDADPEEARRNQVLLDYKTGSAEPGQWLSDRPDQPQLPLYAVLTEQSTLAAVAFANIRPGNGMKLQGYEARTGILPKGIAPPAGDLDSQVNEWRTVLETLASEFYRGEAAVLPKSYPATCRYCEQRLVCRLNPETLISEALTEESQDDDSADTGSTEETFG